MYSKGNRTRALVESYDTVHDSLKRKTLEDINNLIAKRSVNFDGKNHVIGNFFGYHIPKLVTDHGSFNMFTGQGVGKNSDDAKKLYFLKSNNWDTTQDVIQLEAQQNSLQGLESEKRKYTKRKIDYWEAEIRKIQKKRPMSKVSVNQNGVAATSTCSSRTTRDLSKLTVKELSDVINAKPGTHAKRTE